MLIMIIQDIQQSAHHAKIWWYMDTHSSIWLQLLLKKVKCLKRGIKTWLCKEACRQREVDYTLISQLMTLHAVSVIEAVETTAHLFGKCNWIKHVSPELMVLLGVRSDEVRVVPQRIKQKHQKQFKKEIVAWGSGKICLHSILPKPHLWDFNGYAVVVECCSYTGMLSYITHGGSGTACCLEESLYILI